MGSLSRSLRAWRRVGGLSQRQLAARSGVGFVTIARLETGPLDPRFSTLEKLAQGLGIGLAALIDGPPRPGQPTRRRQQRQQPARGSRTRSTR